MGKLKYRLLKGLIIKYVVLAVLFYRDFRHGQIYIFRNVNYDNPFITDDEKYLVEIINVKDGWVNYKHLNRSVFQNEASNYVNFNFCYKLYSES